MNRFLPSAMLVLAFGTLLLACGKESTSADSLSSSAAVSLAGSASVKRTQCAPLTITLNATATELLTISAAVQSGSGTLYQDAACTNEEVYAVPLAVGSKYLTMFYQSGGSNTGPVTVSVVVTKPSTAELVGSATFTFRVN